MRFLRLLFWESLQNLPVVAGLAGGMLLWRDKPALSIACMAAGGLLCALAIAATERHMWRGFHESARVVAANVALMGALSIAAVAYLHAPWGRWWSDALAGVVAGIALGVTQDIAAGRRRLDLRHGGTLGVAVAVALLLTRALFFGLLPAIGAPAVLAILFALNVGLSAWIVRTEYVPYSDEIA